MLSQLLRLDGVMMVARDVADVVSKRSERAERTVLQKRTVRFTCLPRAMHQ